MTHRLSRYFTLLLTLAFLPFFSATAQTYDALWRTVAEAEAADRPQTALKELMKIEQRAAAEGNRPQLLRAALMARTCGAELSPDSGRVALQRMEQALQKETQAEARAVWHMALARLYDRLAGRSSTFLPWAAPEGDVDDEAAQQRQNALRHYAAAADSLDLLAAAATKTYAPLLNIGTSSTYYNDDMLHVFLRDYTQSALFSEAQKRAILVRAQALYEARGNESAALLLCLKRDELGEAREQQADTPEARRKIFHTRREATLQLVEKYPKAQTHVDAYVRFLSEARGLVHYDAENATAEDEMMVKEWIDFAKEYGKREKNTGRAGALLNFVDEMQTPCVQTSQFPTLVYPGKPFQFSLHHRALTNVKVRLTRLQLTARQLAALDDEEKQLKAHAGATIWERNVTFGAAPAYAWRTDTVGFTLPSEAGLYLVEMLSGSKRFDHAVVHASRLRPLTLAVKNGKVRLVVVDAMTGAPVGNTWLVQTTGYGKQQRQVGRTKVTEQGITLPALRYDELCYLERDATGQTDAALPQFAIHNGHVSMLSEVRYVRTDLFFDRPIYRPGQKVRVGGVMYGRRGDDFDVKPGVPVTLRLYNARDGRRCIDSAAVVTDAYGAFADSLQLQPDGATGQYYVEALLHGRQNEAANARNYFRVEAYKRPTFTVTVDNGAATTTADSVTLTGKAQTYTGLPVAGARVAWRMTQQQQWRYGARGYGAARFEPLSGETQTDEEGRFTLSVKLPATPATKAFVRYIYNVSFDVTAPNGETASTSHSLFKASRPAYITQTLPKQVCKEQPTPFSVTLHNATGRRIDGCGNVLIKTLVRGDVAAQVAFSQNYASGDTLSTSLFSGCASGRYRVYFTAPEAATDSADVALFSLTDTRPAPDTPLFTHEAGDAGEKALLLGTSLKHVHLFFDILNADNIFHTERLELSDTLQRFSLPYKKEYGEGATAVFAFVKDGTLFTHRVAIERPVPEQRLQLHWTTFRSTLTPGQTEQWTLRVTHPDGRPAAASVVARMYDASLNAFAQNVPQFSAATIMRSVLHSKYQSPSFAAYNASLYGHFPQGKMQTVKALDFTTWQEMLFDRYGYGGAPTRMAMSLRANATPKTRLAEVAMNKVAARGFAQKAVAESAETSVADEALGEIALNGATAPAVPAVPNGVTAPAVPVRGNFGETAFFLPQLTTDAKGEVALTFVLPESLTEWQVDALAHTKNMQHGQLTTSCVARKQLMVQPALPRFVRQGDRVSVPIAVRNVAEQSQRVEVEILISDAETGEQLMRQTQAVVVKDAATISFAFEATEAWLRGHRPTKGEMATAVKVRVMATSAQSADGEEHVIPVLANTERLTHTLPFSLTQRGTHTLPTAHLFPANATHRRLTVEATTSVLWYVVDALPVLDDDDAISADGLAERLYSLTLSAHLAQHDTAFSHGIDAETYAARIAGVADRLKALQQADGGWSWYKGMRSNVSTTTDVCLLLARLQQMTGATPLRYAAAERYLDRAAEEAVKQMQTVEKKMTTKALMLPADWLLRYVYLRALEAKAPTKAVTYLLDKAVAQQLDLTMYGKSVVAVALAKAGRQAEAEAQLTGVLEHTVSTPEMGRYFDTERALRGRASYRIPTQVAAIEALRLLQPESKAVGEMTLWLLQSKRTQAWETSRATSDAIYTLLTSSTTSTLRSEAPLRITVERGRNIVALSASKDVAAKATKGYVRIASEAEAATKATRVVLHKSNDGVSWGSVYADFTAPLASLAPAAKGLAVARRMERYDAASGEWTVVGKGEKLTVGARVRQVFTLEADRDYDFVALRAARAACLEPVDALSGYTWSGTLGYFRQLTDTHTAYFIEHLSKGRHTLVETYRTDRPGHYSAALATLKSVYAPEFQGHTGETWVEVE